MPALFPNSVRIYSSKADLVDTVLADHVNLLQDEVTAVENTLGTGLLASSWSGTFSTPGTHTSVANRLANIEAGILSRPTNSGTGATGTWGISISGNAATATTATSATSATSATTATSAGKWTTARTITLTGDLTGSASIDGSGDVTITATVSQSSVEGRLHPFLLAGI